MAEKLIKIPTMAETKAAGERYHAAFQRWNRAIFVFAALGCVAMIVLIATGSKGADAVITICAILIGVSYVASLDFRMKSLECLTLMCAMEIAHLDHHVHCDHQDHEKDHEQETPTSKSPTPE